MAENLGTGVSYVNNQVASYNYDTVVFQKQYPPLDSEINLVQQLQHEIDSKRLSFLPSGWMTSRPAYTSPLLTNSFYTQNPSKALPEFALVNGHVVNVANTGTTLLNTNLISLGTPPVTGNVINGVFLEVWRALLDPDTSTNKPNPVTVVDALNAMAVVNAKTAWIAGQNGLILATVDGGTTWFVQLVGGTKYNLNGISFSNSMIGWVVGDVGTIARTSSGGANWSILASNVVQNLNSVFAATQLNVFAVGDNGTILMAQNGVTFIPSVSGTTANLNGVWFASSLVGWVVGANGTILKTNNGGASWMALNSGVTTTLNAVSFYDQNTGYVVGDGGVILKTSDGGATWSSQSSNVKKSPSVYTTVTADLYSVSLVPALDQQETVEVSSQFNGTNKNFSTPHVPITTGNGRAITTNNPADVTVTVNGTKVAVDSVLGSTGQVILANLPPLGAVVMITYWYPVPAGTFSGYVYVAGDVSYLHSQYNSQYKGLPLALTATLLGTSDLGANWIPQNPNTAYILRAVDFNDPQNGWVCGDNSVIRATTKGEAPQQIWVTQQSTAPTRQEQRVYGGGNIQTTQYLADDAIHPDANFETSKRVQVQYSIRVINGVDPDNYPDAGLGSTAITALGPNTTGSYYYVNSGATTGDYGLWTAQCPNTVDGYCWAVPMFFVSRRNSSAYDPSTNANGSNVIGSATVRPDFLTATQVVDADILDVRRKIFIPDIQEILNDSFDLLSAGDLGTILGRNATGGDQYGTKLLQLDRVGPSGGGDIISDATSLSYVFNGLITSSVSYQQLGADTTSTADYVFNKPTPASVGYFHPNPSMYSSDYTGGGFDGKTISGAFSGFGTNTVTFSFSPNTLVGTANVGAVLSATWVNTSTTALKYIPTEPKLVEMLASAGPYFYYNGVFQGDSRVVEQWDTKVQGSPSYTIAYPYTYVSDPVQQARASTMELHYFVNLTSSNIVDANHISIPSSFAPVAGDTAAYQIATVSKINNLNAGFSYKIVDIGNTSHPPFTGNFIVASASGFPFVQGITIEVVASVTAPAMTLTSSIRNGATVNFVPGQKSVNQPCVSQTLTASAVSGNQATFTVSNAAIVGISTTEMVTGLVQPFCWMDGTSIQPATILSGMGTSSLTVALTPTIGAATITAQVLCLQTSAPTEFDSMVFSYYRTPYQSVPTLPATLTVELVTKPEVVYVSNLGTGGGMEGDPYTSPIYHIPVNDTAVTDDTIFNNFDPMVFNNFSVDTGFVQMPVHIPARIGLGVTFSNPLKDAQGRSFYGSCSQELLYRTEGMTVGQNRKIYVAMVARVTGVPSTQFTVGEYLMVVMSRNVYASEAENYTGYVGGTGSAIAVYRLPNKPLSRM